MLILLSIALQIENKNCIEAQKQMMGIEESYSAGVYIVLGAATLYCGMYSSLSSHYILRPKIEPLLERLSVSSSLAIEVLVDLLSNLSFITYSACCSFLLPPSDAQPRLLQLYTLYWLTLCLAVVLYLRVGNSMGLSRVVLCKNGLLLGLCFANITYHYLTGTSLITLPAIFVGLYLLNLLLTAYEQKFIQVVFEMLGVQEPPEPKPPAKMISHLPTIEQLSDHYPISPKELDDRMAALREKKSSREVFKFSATKPILNKIDTKIVAREKLMRMCLCVHLSMLKKEEEEVTAVRQYYGSMNGTQSDGGIRGKLTSKQRKTYFNSRNKDKETLCRKTTRKMNSQGGNETTELKLLDGEQPHLKDEGISMENAEGVESESLIFYLFPIRVFEFSRVTSTIFSIFINLGFGVLLSFCQAVFSTLQYGRFFEFALGALLLPMIPRASPMEFLNTLSLATIWKLAIYGLFAIISMVASNDPSLITVLNWTMTPLLQFISLLLLVLLLLCFVVVLLGKPLWKLMLLVFLSSLGLTAWLTYASITA